MTSSKYWPKSRRGKNPYSSVHLVISLVELFQVHLFYSDKVLSSFSSTGSSEFAIPVFSQMLFLIFFPTMALVSRINLKKRIKILLFGLLCWFSFILIQFLAIATTLGLGLNVTPGSYV